MSLYEEEVDYSADPLEGVDIWEKETCDEVADMVDMMPASAIPEPASTDHSCELLGI